MKFFYRIFIFSCMALFSGLLISWVEADARLQKKLDKQIAKIWADGFVQKNELVPIENSSLSTDRIFYKLLKNNELVGYATINRSYGCRVGGCAVYSTSTDKEGNYDPFYYSIITNNELSIKKVVILEYYSEYGHQITNNKWLAQFVGLQQKEVVYVQSIDAISGATISVKSLIEDVDATLGEMRDVIVALQKNAIK